MAYAYEKGICPQEGRDAGTSDERPAFVGWRQCFCRSAVWKRSETCTVLIFRFAAFNPETNCQEEWTLFRLSDTPESATFLTQVTLPDSLQTIDIHAFYGCDRLAQISLPSSICFIENYEFRTYDDILEDDIVIPGLVVTVAPGTYAEQYCREQGIPYEYAK